VIMREHAAMSDAPLPVSQAVLDDLRRRLVAFRPVALPQGVGWGRGTDAEYLADLLAYWANSYDWRTHESRILARPWVRTTAGGFAARAIHQRADDEGAPVVVLLHGWPDSVLRFERVLPLLSDVHVVVPALPGYPFAEPLTTTGMSSTTMAEVVAGQLSELGYQRYVVSGGDIGSEVAEALAAAHPGRVAALHLTDVPDHHMLSIKAGDLSASEKRFLAADGHWHRGEGGYLHEQSTKPHTLAVGLGDSPAGLAAWIVEKLRSWSDCGGDVESVFPRDELLTWVTAYWVSGTIGTSFSPYVEPIVPVDRLAVPAAFSLFPHDLVTPPRSFAERFFDVRFWDEPSGGGHFAAWERPDAYVAGVRAALAARAIGARRACPPSCSTDRNAGQEPLG
jgi:pimeloyl-ACP methyl ester carboxylesterase